MYTKVFLDLDGTVYLGKHIIDSVEVEIRRLHEKGVAFYYMTNNTSLCTSDYVHKLEGLGLPVSDAQVISPTRALVQYLQKNDIRKIFTVGTAAFDAEVMAAANVEFCHNDAEVVIIGFDKELSYPKLEGACRLINRGVPYYLTHIDLACPSPDGPIPDCGAIGRLLEATTGKKPAGHFGKPEGLLDYVRSLCTSNDRLLVAGDRIYTDAAIGAALGADTLLVRSGEYRDGPVDLDYNVMISDTLAHFLRGVS